MNDIDYPAMRRLTQWFRFCRDTNGRCVLQFGFASCNVLECSNFTESGPRAIWWRRYWQHFRHLLRDAAAAVDHRPVTIGTAFALQIFMAYFDENKNLEQLEQFSEEQIQEMRRQLSLTHDEAKQELKQQMDRCGEAAARSIEALDGLADDADRSLAEVREQLGQFNLLLALEEIDDPRSIEVFRERITEQFAATWKTINRITAESAERFEDSRGELESAWYAFLQRLEIVQAHLEATVGQTMEAFERERSRLDVNLSGREWSRDEEESDYSMFKRWIKGFFQHPDVAVPEASTKS